MRLKTLKEVVEEAETKYGSIENLMKTVIMADMNMEELMVAVIGSLHNHAEAIDEHNARLEEIEEAFTEEPAPEDMYA